MGELVRDSIKDRVATVTLSRPELHNAFNEKVMEELAEAFTRLGSEPQTRLIVLAGEGKSFCAGADINWMKKMVDYSFDENVEDATVMARMLTTIRDCPKPVIARIHGATIGGGVGLVGACDMAVAVKDAMFCLSEVRLGLVPAVISPFVMEKIGLGHARRYALTAERFDAAEARRIGLISEVVDSVEALDAWIAMIAESIRASGPEAVGHCKAILRTASGSDPAAVEAATTRTIAERRASDEGQEGLKAFLEKRKPNWIAPS